MPVCRDVCFKICSHCCGVTNPDSAGKLEAQEIAVALQSEGSVEAGSPLPGREGIVFLLKAFSS